MRETEAKRFDSYFQEKDGVRYLEDRVFKHETFSNFLLKPLQTPTLFMRNVVVDSCRFDYHVAYIRRGATLEDVTFINLYGVSELIVDADDVHLNKVVIKGRQAPKSLRIFPSEQNKGRLGQFNYPDYDLDISEYGGEVDIIGVDVTRIKCDPARHVKIFSNRLSDLKNMDTLHEDVKVTFFVLKKRFESFQSEEAIIDLNSEEESYKKEMFKLRAMGIVE